jgi:carbon monoxide dehydrogenase subunit G
VVKEKNPAAVALGRLGGKIGGKVRMAKLSVEQHAELSAKGGRAGGKARAKKLTSERRSEIARKAAETRWAKQNGGSDSLN